MKRNKGFTLALIAIATLTIGSSAALAQPGYGMGGQGYNQLTPEQQTTLQKLHNDYYTQTSQLRQQLMSKRYEYNALLTASSPDSAKIESVANEIATLNQQLDQQRVKFDIALAESGVSRGAGMGYGGCGGGMHRGGGHMGMGMGRW